MGDEVSHVVFTPDGKHALAAKNSANKVALLDVAGDKITYTKRDMLTGLYPYSVEVSPTAKSLSPQIMATAAIRTETWTR